MPHRGKQSERLTNPEMSRGSIKSSLRDVASPACSCCLHPGLGIDVPPRRLATLSLTSWNRRRPEGRGRAGQTLSVCSWERLQVRADKRQGLGADMDNTTLTPVWTQQENSAQQFSSQLQQRQSQFLVLLWIKAGIGNICSLQFPCCLLGSFGHADPIPAPSS